MDEPKLSARIRNALRREGMSIDPESLSQLEFYEICRIRELGNKSQQELRDWLKSQGRDFKNPPADKVTMRPPLSDELDAVNFLKSRGYNVHRIWPPKRST